MRLFPVLLLLAAGLLSLSPARAQVTREDVIAMANSYLQLEWTPTAQNVFHGRDAQNVMVHTPDQTYLPNSKFPGWWIPGQKNVGMPYQWGGFSTPAEFLAGLEQGAYAGDVYSPEKRRLDNSAVSKQAAGIDCSGLVSRCWRLERAYSTYELPTLCLSLGSYDELKPGDILNLPNKHVMIFKSFVDQFRDSFDAYEAGALVWKVQLNRRGVANLRQEGFQPLRYRKIVDGAAATAPLTPAAESTPAK